MTTIEEDRPDDDEGGDDAADDDLLEGQEGKGYGEDEGEREGALDDDRPE